VDGGWRRSDVGGEAVLMTILNQSPKSSRDRVSQRQPDSLATVMALTRTLVGSDQLAGEPGLHSELVFQAVEISRGEVRDPVGAEIRWIGVERVVAVVTVGELIVDVETPNFRLQALIGPPPAEPTHSLVRPKSVVNTLQ
jgi:hypothetical protein